MRCICEFPPDCGGGGLLHCRGCGGDLCVCRCGGELECQGCSYCCDNDSDDHEAGCVCNHCCDAAQAAAKEAGF